MEFNNLKATLFVVIAMSMLAGATIIVVSGIILVSTEKRRNRIASLLPDAAD